MKANFTSEIDEAIVSASNALLWGWDWPQAFRDSQGNWRIIASAGEIEELPDEGSRNTARLYEGEVQNLFLSARMHAEKARNYLMDDKYEAALEELQDAARFEARTGDNPAMRHPLEMLNGLLDAVDSIELDLRAVDRAWQRNPEAEMLPGSVIWGPRASHAASFFIPRDAMRLALMDMPRELWAYTMEMANLDIDDWDLGESET